jgi:hypothetical protein
MEEIERLAIECAELKIKAGFYTDEYDTKKVLLDKLILETGENKYKTELGSFRRQPKTTYTFSPEYDKAKSDLDVLKQEEINQKIAIPVVNYSLVFNIAK